MRANEIIYREYRDEYTKHLNAVIKRKQQQGLGFEASVWNRKLQRWVRAATSEVVKNAFRSLWKATTKRHLKTNGRERLTLRDINNLRKQRQLMNRQEYTRLQNIENIYRNRDD
jgi:hypothetical protein